MTETPTSETNADASETEKNTISDIVDAADDTARLSGIDVSHYQGSIDWRRVHASGVFFAYVKATEGLTWADNKYADNVNNAKEEGIFVGSYHLFVPGDGPTDQATHFLGSVDIGAGDLPPALDIEPLSAVADGTDVVRRIQMWLDHIEEATGCRPIIYSGEGNWQSFLSGNFDDYDIWLAEYTTRSSPRNSAPEWLFWQHNDKGCAFWGDPPPDSDFIRPPVPI